MNVLRKIAFEDFDAGEPLQHLDFARRLRLGATLCAPDSISSRSHSRCAVLEICSIS